jgi:hypothetical protein
MNLAGHVPALLRGVADIKRLWEDTKETWNDAVSQDVERLFQQPLERDVAATLEAMNRLGPLLEQAKQECA